MPRISTICLLPLFLWLTACGEDHPIVPPRVQTLPTQFRLTGEAVGTDSTGITATCSLDLFFEMRTKTFVTPQLVDYKGVHGGEVFRRILDESGAGFAFFADVFGEVEARLITHNGAVNLVIPVNETAEGRFWRALSRFEGTVDESGRGSGAWTCAPLDIDQGGYMDTSVTVDGSWQMEPVGTQ